MKERLHIATWLQSAMYWVRLSAYNKIVRYNYPVVKTHLRVDL